MKKIDSKLLYDPLYLFEAKNTYIIKLLYSIM